MPSPALTPRQKIERMVGELEQDVSSWLPQWTDLSNFIVPMRSVFNRNDSNRGVRRSQNIIDSTATFALRTLEAGLMAGITSPARLWFRLTSTDDALAEDESVKLYLHEVTKGMAAILLKSNFYQSMPAQFGDLGVYATAAMAMLEDDEQVVRFSPYPIGTFMLGTDHKRRVRIFARKFSLTVRQMVEEFGEDKVSTATLSLYRADSLQQKVDVVHVVQPNADYDDTKIQSKHKAFYACYYEPGAQEPGKNGFLREEGFDEFPIIASRWRVAGDDVYGTDSPGMVTLGDIKSLQTGKKRQLQAIEKGVNPPMNANPLLMNTALSVLPGNINYVPPGAEGKGFSPTYEINPQWLNFLQSELETIRFLIRRGFYEDTFLTFAANPALDHGDKTAREIDAREEEKLMALGTMYGQFNQDALDPIIDRLFAIMSRKGLLPEPPEALQGQPLKIEYISIMAQAQKMVGISGIERFTSYVTNLATLSEDPSIYDKVDRDQLIDEYGDMLGVPPAVIVADDKVLSIRQSRAQQQQAQQQAEMLKTASEGAKNLASADTSGKNALTDLIGSAA